jgi:hypothetical protein
VLARCQLRPLPCGALEIEQIVKEHDLAPVDRLLAALPQLPDQARWPFRPDPQQTFVAE